MEKQINLRKRKSTCKYMINEFLWDGQYFTIEELM